MKHRAMWQCVLVLAALICCGSVRGASGPETPGAGSKEPDVVVHYRGTFAAFPDVIRLANGDLLMVTREATHHMEDQEHGRVIGRISTDEGHTWGEAMVICDHPDVDDRDPFAYQTKDGTVWVGCQGQRKDQVYDTYVIRSFNNGRTWEKPILVSKSHEDFFIMYPVTEMSNGQFLWMGCSKIIDYDAQGKRIHLQRSKQNWHITAILENPKAAGDEADPFKWTGRVHKNLGQFDEWDIVESEAGHLIAILRSSPDSNQFAQADSYDGGRTWQNYRPNGIVHNWGNRPRIDKLADGTLVVSYGLRRESKIAAIPSFDGGKTWPANRRVTVLYNPNYGPNPDFTYTAMVPTPTKDGKYLFIYYAHPGKHGGNCLRGIYGSFVPAVALHP